MGYGNSYGYGDDRDDAEAAMFQEQTTQYVPGTNVPVTIKTPVVDIEGKVPSSGEGETKVVQAEQEYQPGASEAGVLGGGGIGMWLLLGVGAGVIWLVYGKKGKGGGKRGAKRRSPRRRAAPRRRRRR